MYNVCVMMMVVTGCRDGVNVFPGDNGAKVLRRERRNEAVVAIYGWMGFGDGLRYRSCVDKKIGECVFTCSCR